MYVQLEKRKEVTVGMFQCGNGDKRSGIWSHGGVVAGGRDMLRLEFPVHKTKGISQNKNVCIMLYKYK